MSQALLIIAIIVVVIGALGTLLPILPGTPVICVAAIAYGWYEGFSKITPLTIVILLVLMVVTYGIDYISGILGAKKYGASKYGTWGSLIGGILGFVFLSIPGIVIGPLAGAIIGEVIAGKKLNEASKVGLGTLVGMAVGSAVKFSIACAMAAIFITKVL